jgi:hypothetical protein
MSEFDSDIFLAACASVEAAIARDGRPAYGDRVARLFSELGITREQFDARQFHQGRIEANLPCA